MYEEDFSEDDVDSEIEIPETTRKNIGHTPNETEQKTKILKTHDNDHKSY